MKKTLLLFILLSALCSTRASDTLTIRQVFNFDVGDTFDYIKGQNLQIGHVGPSLEQTYSRYVIVGKIPSITNDTVTYIRQQLYPTSAIDTLRYYHLDSSTYWLFDTVGYGQTILIDTGHLADGRITNSYFNGCGLCYNPQYLFGEGLGQIRYRQGETDGTSYWGEYDEFLIYYAKGTEVTGTTYYNAIGPRLPHFTPIPEDCAFWNYEQIFPYNHVLMYSQIRTGTKTYLNNHTYVQLILRTYDPDSSRLSADSTLGYFRNDTAAHKVYFRKNINSADSLLYDFTLYSSELSNFFQWPNYYLSLDTINIGGIRRVVWHDQYSFFVGSFYEYSYTYVEGVGALDGFVTIAPIYKNGFHSRASLTSFCVCGDILYPYSLGANCFVLTGINDISESTSPIHLYPNPTTDLLHLSFPEARQYNTSLIITNLLGQQVYSSLVMDSESTHDISVLSSGMYTWRLMADDKMIKAGKLVKQ